MSVRQRESETPESREMDPPTGFVPLMRGVYAGTWAIRGD